MKNALMVIAPRMFRDEEYFETKRVLEDAGVRVDTASQVKGACRGKLGAVAQAGLLVREADPQGYDAVVFVGGGGAECYLNDRDALALARNACDRGKLVAAICMAPLILAAAGILKGKKATVFDTDAEELVRAGARYTGGELEIDGNILTASDASVSVKFGEKIVELLQKP